MRKKTYIYKLKQGKNYYDVYTQTHIHIVNKNYHACMHGARSAQHSNNKNRNNKCAMQYEKY